MKKILIVISILAVGVVLVLFFTDKQTDAIKFKKEYEALNGVSNASNTQTYSHLSISKTNTIKYKSEKEIIGILKNETGIVYFGFPNCPWCRVSTEVLLEVAEKEEKDIYYLNTLDIRSSYSVDEEGKLTLTKNGTREYHEILKILDEYLEDFVLTTTSGKKINVGEKRLYSPTAVFVKEGEVLGIHVGTVDSQENPYEKLSKEQREELESKYLNYINKIF